MGGDLDQHVRLRQVERRIGHLTHEDGVHLGVELEVLQDLDPLTLWKCQKRFSSDLTKLNERVVSVLWL